MKVFRIQIKTLLYLKVKLRKKICGNFNRNEDMTLCTDVVHHHVRLLHCAAVLPSTVTVQL